MVQRGELSQKRIFTFWWPLAVTWLMMSLEGPFVAAVIARLPGPKPNLAAYGVAFTFAMLLESPIHHGFGGTGRGVLAPSRRRDRGG